MNIAELKNYLYSSPEKIQFILEDNGFHHIKIHSGTADSYFTYGNKDGDNPTACTTYITPSLLTINYTRNICQSKDSCDLIDLISFVRETGLFETLKYISEISGISYYHKFNDDMPESLRIIKKIKEMLNKASPNEEDNIPITPKDERILSYYLPYVNDTFYNDSISYSTQVVFGIGLDPFSGYITIPIKDELGVLVGVKGRWFDREVPCGILKYYYLETCPRHKILYGYHLTKNHIKESKEVYVLEAEKSVMQAWSHGYKNSVATMGKKISSGQIDKLNRLGVDVTLAFDKDVKKEELESIAEKFAYGVNVYALIDEDNVLPDKYSPTDDKDLFEKMIKENKIKLK